MAATFSSSRVAMVQIDPATRRFVAVNPSMCRLVGYTEPELLNMELQDVTHPDDGLDPAGLAALLRGDAAYREEKCLVRKDGSVVWTEISGSVVRDTQGHPLRVVGFIQDISARRQAEDALREREARQAFLVRLNDGLKALQDQQAIVSEAARLLVNFLGVEHAGYGEVDPHSETVGPGSNVARGVAEPQGTLRLGNPGFLRDLRAGQTLVRHDIAHDPSLTPDERQHFAQLQIGASVAVPLTQASQVHAVFFVHARFARNWTPDDVALVEDVAQRVRADIERARAEAEVRRARSQLKTALESMNDAVLICDAEGCFVEFNAAFASFHRFRSGLCGHPRGLHGRRHAGTAGAVGGAAGSAR
jgi:PAS domain S-box-containing protein